MWVSFFNAGLLLQDAANIKENGHVDSLNLYGTSSRKGSYLSGTMENRKTRKLSKKGALTGVLIGVIGTLVTYVTGDISFISVPVVLLFSLFGAGLLFLSHLFEFLAVVTFYALIGATVGYLIDRRNE